MLIFPQLGAALTLLLALLAIVSPVTIEKFVSVKAVAKLVVSEIRATYMVASFLEFPYLRY